MKDPPPRKYELKRRAEQQLQTRRRIVEAAVELHSTVGPARTTISAIAERAGVRRPTVYSHFPDERALLTACSGHVYATSPPPDPTAWADLPELGARVRAALEALYPYFRSQEALLLNITRDLETMPLLREIAAGRFRYLRELREAVAAGSRARGARRERLLAAIALALDFRTWHRLVRGEELPERDAIELMVKLVTAV